jgi:hypothetical protein
MRELSKYLSALNSLGFVLSDEKGCRDPQDPLYILSLEIEADCEASILLAISGFYRHANLALRSWLALAFQSVWFSFDRAGFAKWMSSEPKAPFSRGDVMSRRCLKELMKWSQALEKAESQFNLVENSMILYEELSSFVHATGKKVLDIYSRDDSVPHFYPEHTESWLARFRRVSEIWVILTFARYTDLLDMRCHRGEKEEALSRLAGDRRVKLEDLREL